jgi:hypothetical protein
VDQWLEASQKADPKGLTAVDGGCDAFTSGDESHPVVRASGRAVHWSAYVCVLVIAAVWAW